MKPKSLVPNAPCGVERFMSCEALEGREEVPNAPCGVESAIENRREQLVMLFLMHRVELKAFSSICFSKIPHSS